MSHPDPLYDEDNVNYDDYNDFYREDEIDSDWQEIRDAQDDIVEEDDYVWDDSYDDSMDGDFDSAMRDAGWGTDEDYGYYGEDF